MLESELENGDSNQIDFGTEETVDSTVDSEESVDVVGDSTADSDSLPDSQSESLSDLSADAKPEKGKKTKKAVAEKKPKGQSKKKDKDKDKAEAETTDDTKEVNDENDEGVEKKKSIVIEEELERPKGKDWYILKVQVNREDLIKKQLEQRAKIAGLDQYFGDILVPTEKVTEIRNEKKRIVKRKLYPGYIMIYMEINDDTWFLVRETPGIGDFTGAVGKPTPMLAHEVQRMLAAEKEDPAESPKLKVGYSVGDQIKIKEGSFESLSGVVDAIDYANGRVTVIVNLFGRSTPVELEYWQIEQSSG
ncbi:MAG: transcription termination/antitermination protein NusG [Planctomycetaceae bacterium]|jgi:transcriptional antiterminator NusG|nr:transcription termination/antitermination protein NusG [Planctomycetaceae bacterium]